MSDVVVPRQSAKIAVKYARLPEVKGLFEELSRRDETLAVMQAEFIESIKRNRAVREGKPVQLSKQSMSGIARLFRQPRVAVFYSMPDALAAPLTIAH